MEPAAPEGGGQNRAWVRIATPLSADRLLAFSRDAERLLRMNPLLELGEWQELGPSRVRAVVRNLSNGQSGALDFEIEETPGGLRIRYLDGIKRLTDLRVEPRGAAADLVITDEYAELSAAEYAERQDEVDRSLVPWGHALFRYLRAWRRWSWLPPWRWYMRRVWQPMKPSSRRIVRMLWLVTLLELLAFLFVLAIWVLEHPG
jgi:hypothetical protein